MDEQHKYNLTYHSIYTYPREAYYHEKKAKCNICGEETYKFVSINVLKKDVVKVAVGGKEHIAVEYKPVKIAKQICWKCVKKQVKKFLNSY